MSRVFTYGDFKLRKPEERDWKGLVAISDDWDVMEFYGENDGICRSKEEGKAQVKWAVNEFSRNGGRWIVVEKEKNEYIGDIGFSGYDEKHRRGEVGYRLMKEYWGRGIISTFIGQLTDWAFDDLNYNRIEALVDVRNEGSKKVLLKNGFIREGILREYEYEYGHFVDLEMYSRLKKDRENLPSPPPVKK